MSQIATDTEEPGPFDTVENVILVVCPGGALRQFVSPEVAFTLAAAIGVVGTGYFLVFGEEFEAYA